MVKKRREGEVRGKRKGCEEVLKENDGGKKKKRVKEEGFNGREDKGSKREEEGIIREEKEGER